MSETDVSDLIEQLLVAGVPTGMWLAEIEQALANCEQTAASLRRLRSAVKARLTAGDHPAPHE